MVKRLFDIFFSSIGIIFLLPVFFIVAVIIVFTSKGGVFYIQKRVGKNGIDFSLFKFRTMKTGSDSKGLLTVGGRDSRITRVGYYLRKYKLDELPQLLNVFLGDMSLVGPRPEVRKYVNLYNEQQRQVLLVKPGITDFASIEFIDENEILGKSTDPEKTYIVEVMPAKLELNIKYINNQGLFTDIGIILKTILKIFR
ncbi:MAG: sugar transferase [Bacteroidota bacterium]|jgi:lipopolysaccharide/colanic/teichoic acid biosynthesis glycosyltransferase